MAVSTVLPSTLKSILPPTQAWMIMHAYTPGSALMPSPDHRTRMRVIGFEPTRELALSSYNASVFGGHIPPRILPTGVPTLLGAFDPEYDPETGLEDPNCREMKRRDVKTRLLMQMHINRIADAADEVKETLASGVRKNKWIGDPFQRLGMLQDEIDDQRTQLLDLLGVDVLAGASTTPPTSSTTTNNTGARRPNANATPDIGGRDWSSDSCDEAAAAYEVKEGFRKAQEGLVKFPPRSMDPQQQYFFLAVLPDLLTRNKRHQLLDQWLEQRAAVIAKARGELMWSLLMKNHGKFPASQEEAEHPDMIVPSSIMDTWLKVNPPPEGWLADGTWVGEDAGQATAVSAGEEEAAACIKAATNADRHAFQEWQDDKRLAYETELWRWLGHDHRPVSLEFYHEWFVAGHALPDLGAVGPAEDVIIPGCAFPTAEATRNFVIEQACKTQDLMFVGAREAPMYRWGFTDAHVEDLYTPNKEAAAILNDLAASRKEKEAFKLELQMAEARRLAAIAAKASAAGEATTHVVDGPNDGTTGVSESKVGEDEGGLAAVDQTAPSSTTASAKATAASGKPAYTQDLMQLLEDLTMA